MGRKRIGLVEEAQQAGRALVAAVYSRVSLDARKDQRSVEEQDDENREHCADREWTIGEHYCDNDVSASRFSRKERPDWDRLLEDLAARRFEVLVLWESSRGDRKLGRWIYLLDLCRELGVLIHVTSHDHTYDVRKRRDYKTLAEEGLDSADESEKTSDRLQRDKEKMARNGSPHGRNLYGYKRIYVVDGNGRRRIAEVIPDEVPRQAVAADGTVSSYTAAGVVREIFRRMASGDGLRNISVDLNVRGVASPRGSDRGWHTSAIRQLAANPGYIARRVYRGQVLEGVEAQWPPLVDENVFFACAARMSRASADYRSDRRDGSVKFLLTWLAVCGVCGRHMRRVGPRARPLYQCDPGAKNDGGGCVGRRVDHVDAFVQMSIWERLARPDIVELLAQDRRADERYAQLEAEIAQKQQQIRKAQEGLARGALDADDLAAVKAILVPEIARARAQMEQQRVAPVLRGFIGETVEAIEAEWWGRSLQQRREVIRVLTERVVILPLGRRRNYEPHESVDIVWRKSV